MKKSYRIEVDCANCANKMEVAAARVPGVEQVNVNFMTQKMIVSFSDGADPAKVMQEVAAACKKVERDCFIEL